MDKTKCTDTQTHILLQFTNDFEAQAIEITVVFQLRNHILGSYTAGATVNTTPVDPRLTPPPAHPEGHRTRTNRIGSRHRRTPPSSAPGREEERSSKLKACLDPGHRCTAAGACLDTIIRKPTVPNIPHGQPGNRRNAAAGGVDDRQGDVTTTQEPNRSSGGDLPEEGINNVVSQL
ncbi:succinate dehydrogenase 2-2, partial [Striga asiatica]